jgi:hypothetical protein
MARGEGSRARRNQRARDRGGENYRSRPIETQAVEAPSGRAYGDRKESEDAQREIPLPDAAGQQRADLAAALQAAQQAQPMEGGLAAPTARPGEPVTQGLPTGPGAGPEALNPGAAGTGDADLLRRLLLRYPTEAMRRLVERVDREQGLDRPPQAGMRPTSMTAPRSVPPAGPPGPSAPPMA